MSRLWIVGLALVLVALLPDVAHACPVCFDARAETREAFLVTTAFMTLLPLGMVAGTGLWLRHRSREADRGQERGSESGHDGGSRRRDG